MNPANRADLCAIQFLEVEPAREKPLSALKILLDTGLVVSTAYFLGDAPGLGLIRMLDLALAPDELVTARLQSQAELPVALTWREFL